MLAVDSCWGHKVHEMHLESVRCSSYCLGPGYLDLLISQDTVCWPVAGVTVVDHCHCGGQLQGSLKHQQGQHPRPRAAGRRAVVKMRPFAGETWARILEIPACSLLSTSLPCSITNWQYFLANLVTTFAAFGCHCSLWPKATTFERSQRGYLRPSTAIVQ